MKQIICQSAGLAWQEAINLVFDNGQIVKDGEKDLKELLNVALTINNPTILDKIIKKYSDKKMIEWMYNNFLGNQPIDTWGYSYGQRLNNYLGINQLDEIVKKLTKNPDSKSATACLMYPPEDKKHVPCIVALDFKIRNGSLMASSFFRSQDAGKKLYADILSIGKIMNQIARDLDIKVGSLTIFIASLHIYMEDVDKITNIRKEVLK